jgi:nucleoid DNA-binding protein
MNWRSTRGKSALIKMLMREHRFSKRKSEKAVNAVFDCMARALRRGERVELPVGWMQAVSPPPGQKKRLTQKFRNIQTAKTFFRIVRHPDRIIKFRPNPKLIERGPFAPPPLTQERIKEGEELEQLLERLGFSKYSGPELTSLFEAADDDLARLLARLRQLLREGWKFTDFAILRDSVRQMHWIRK